MTNMIDEKWFVQADGKGAFNACFEMTGDVPRAALSGVTLEQAQAHVDRAIRTNRERNAHMALVNHLFDSSNWKLATSREVCCNLISAYAYKNALAFFCGGAEIRQLPNGEFAVGSLGYYHYCGA